MCQSVGMGMSVGTSACTEMYSGSVCVCVAVAVAGVCVLAVGSQVGDSLWY